MSEGEEKEKKMEELRKNYLKKQAETERRHEEIQMELLLKRILEDSAKNRLSNVKIANQKLYTKTVAAIFQLIQEGRINRKINEEELKSILMQLSEKKEITIKRK
jgi:programmed cell death protein 5